MALDKKKTRIVDAPGPVRSAAHPSAQNRIQSVVVAEDEDVHWQWTVLAGGGRIVTGYTIVKRKDSKGSNAKSDTQHH